MIFFTERYLFPKETPSPSPSDRLASRNWHFVSVLEWLMHPGIHFMRAGRSPVFAAGLKRLAVTLVETWGGRGDIPRNKTGADPELRTQPGGSNGDGCGVKDGKTSYIIWMNYSQSAVDCTSFVQAALCPSNMIAVAVYTKKGRIGNGLSAAGETLSTGFSGCNDQYFI